MAPVEAPACAAAESCAEAARVTPAEAVIAARGGDLGRELLIPLLQQIQEAELYQSLLGRPLGEVSHRLLHRTYTDRSRLAATA